jgi:hypothetical protein
MAEKRLTLDEADFIMKLGGISFSTFHLHYTYSVLRR